MAMAEGASPSIGVTPAPHFSCFTRVPTRRVYNRPLSSRAATCPAVSTTLPVTGRRALYTIVLLSISNLTEWYIYTRKYWDSCGLNYQQFHRISQHVSWINTVCFRGFKWGNILTKGSFICRYRHRNIHICMYKKESIILYSLSINVSKYLIYYINSISTDMFHLFLHSSSSSCKID